jgi:glycosyltransferase involved in cell wall biosynthesis
VKILLHTNYPGSGTGYGEQAAIVAPRLAAMGHDVAISAMTGLSNRADKWEGIPCLPSGYTTYGNDVLGGHARAFFGGGPGLVLVLYDAWAIEPQAIRGLATAVWAPVHSWPLSGGDKRFWIESRAQPIAISRYGEQQMREFGLQPAYVPHGIDCQTFRPLTSGERVEARRVMGVPDDAFVIAIVGANKGTSPPRKAWGEQFQAFAQFRKRHEDAVLYVHSIAASPHGIDMRPMAASLGIEKSVYFSANYPQITGLYPPGYVAGVMGAADVLSNPSYGEGFGLPVVEAQACGTPVVVADTSAQPECAAPVDSGVPAGVGAADDAWWHVPSGPIVRRGAPRLRPASTSLREKARSSPGRGADLRRHVLETRPGDARAVLRRGTCASPGGWDGPAPHPRVRRAPVGAARLPYRRLDRNRPRGEPGAVLRPAAPHRWRVRGRRRARRPVGAADGAEGVAGGCGGGEPGHCRRPPLPHRPQRR